MKQRFDSNILAKIASVTNKRAKILLDHIVEHGYITTDELKSTYNYDHAPRAARDVRELGFVLETRMMKKPDGKRVGAYVLVGLAEAGAGKDAGRKAFPKALKDELLKRDKSTCRLCGAKYEGRLLQIDHRVPYEVAGETRSEAKHLMLVCGSCNRSKSWTCESCENWRTQKDVEACLSCMLATPEKYTHIALEQRRGLSLNWLGSEVQEYERLHQAAAKQGLTAADLAKRFIAKGLREQ